MLEQNWQEMNGAVITGLASKTNILCSKNKKMMKKGNLNWLVWVLD